MSKPLDDTVAVSRREIVIGLVGALGTDLEHVEDVLKNSLLHVGYQAKPVRVSSLIDQASAHLNLDLPEKVPATQLDELMDKGDALRTRAATGAVTAALAVSAISSARYTALRDSGAEERESTATIIRQLKHPEEVRLLRSTYGSRFVLLGAWAPRSEREHAIQARLQQVHSGEEAHWYAQQVVRLLERDEKDGLEPLGQRVRDTFELADAYVALLPGRQIDDTVGRLVRLLFGAPFETPTRQEQAMHQASGARLRSAASGRQVGAVVVDGDGEILVTGTNDVPKPGGGQYWSQEEPDFRDFIYGYDQNDIQQTMIMTEIFRRLHAANWLAQERQSLSPEMLAREALGKGGSLEKSRIGDLLEFGRIMHAEMAAICTAARRGTSIGGQTMYTTTYPCHECARLIIGAGISRLVYVDPYPKSQVPVMYKDEVIEGPSFDSSKVIFEPFQGIAPRLYQSVFAIRGRDRDNVTGKYHQWDPSIAQPRLIAAADTVYPIQYMEDHVTKQLAGWLDG